MVTLYIKKEINNFRDLKWLESEINFHTRNQPVPVILKVNKEIQHIKKMMEVMYVNKHWSIKEENKQGQMMSPNNNIVTIKTSNNNILYLKK